MNPPDEGTTAGTAALPSLELFIAGLPVVSIDPVVDFPVAAGLHRAVRSGGRTVRSLVDCLIAVTAARSDAEFVHRDADYDVLAEVIVGLRVRAYVER